MVGIVIVSHSSALAAGVAELARAMAGAETRIEAVGGMDAPGRPLGTDPLGVAVAIERADSGDGAIVLMDLGSAVLSAEMALDMLSADRRDRVVLCEAPIAEGAVSAAVQCGLGSPLGVVVAEARASLTPKAGHLGLPAASLEPIALAPGSGGRPGVAEAVRLTVPNELGLHARPVARLVRLHGEHREAGLSVRNLSSGAGPVSMASLNGMATMGAVRGDTLEFSASGPGAASAFAAVCSLFLDNLGDPGGDAGDAVGTLSSAEPVRPAEPVADDAGAYVLRGARSSGGLALGPAYWRGARKPNEAGAPDAGPAPSPADLDVALAAARSELVAIREGLAARGASAEAGIIDAQLAMLDDPALLGPAREGRGGLRVDAAWVAACDAAAAGYAAMDSAYMRARSSDVVDLRDRVLGHLTGRPGAGAEPTEPYILLADELAPSVAATLDPSRVLAVCSAGGGATSHASILARGLGIPAVSALGAALRGVQDGARLAVDGDSGIVVVEPSSAFADAFAARVAARSAQEDRASAVASGPVTWPDGRSMALMANVGSLAEASVAAGRGADGIGLLRSEFLFADRSTAPDEEEQYELYASVAAAMKGRPLIVRTLDAGGDKPLGFISLGREANPFLGWRGIRVSLGHPELFKTQLRAVLRAAAAHPIKVMFPMISAKAEFVAARDLLERARDELAAEGLPVPERMEAGAMIEVPAAAIRADSLATVVDFFSIGTNDLTQYTLACERGNQRVAALADYRDPAVLRLIRSVVDAARPRSLPVGICGEMGGDPSLAALLVGLGVDELSMAAPAIPAMRRALETVDPRRAAALADEALRMDSAEAVAALLASGAP